MCSGACSGIKSNLAIRQSQDWEISGSEADEDESIIFVGRKCRSLPNVVGGAEITTAFDKSNTERTTKRSCGYSLENKMKDWHRSLAIDIKAERAAKKYTEMVKDDTLKHLRNSIFVAGSMVRNGADINEELRRQEGVLRKAETDMSVTEYKTDQTTQTLRGMTSLTGKLTSTLRTKKAKLKLQTYNDYDLLNGEMGLCSLSKSCSGLSTPQYKGSIKDKKERQIKAGMGELHTALDFITMQQIDAAWTLNGQDGRLSVFEKKLDRTHSKINSQSQVLNSIMSK